MKLLITSILYLIVGTSARPISEQNQSSVGCTCSAWHELQGGPNTQYYRICTNDYGFINIQIKDCGYCPEPISDCP
jgi:hypothetical protein